MAGGRRVAPGLGLRVGLVMRNVHFPARIAGGELGVVNKLVTGEDEGARDDREQALTVGKVAVVPIPTL